MSNNINIPLLFPLKHMAIGGRSMGGRVGEWVWLAMGSEVSPF